MPETSAQQTNFLKSAALLFPSTKICSRRSTTSVKPHQRRKSKPSISQGTPLKTKPATTTVAGHIQSFPVLKASTATKCRTTSRAQVARSSGPSNLKSSLTAVQSKSSWRMKVSTRGPSTSSKLSVRPQLSKCSSQERRTPKKHQVLLQVSTQSMTSTNRQKVQPSWASCQNSAMPLITPRSLEYPSIYVSQTTRCMPLSQRITLPTRTITHGPYKSFLRKAQSLTSLPD